MWSYIRVPAFDVDDGVGEVDDDADDDDNNNNKIFFT
jgi:hypothetical protein